MTENSRLQSTDVLFKVIPYSGQYKTFLQSCTLIISRHNQDCKNLTAVEEYKCMMWDYIQSVDFIINIKEKLYRIPILMSIFILNCFYTIKVFLEIIRTLIGSFRDGSREQLLREELQVL